MALQEPIVKGLPEDQNGTITFLGDNPRGEGFDHIFSFVFYLVQGVAFEESKYYIGMKAYIDMIHTTITPFPFSCGMIVYTNPSTLEFLLSAFPLDRYPKLTFAVVEWPMYSYPTGGGIDMLVLRCLRFQAIDHYPTKYVHMRDADTLFVVKINEGPVFTKLVFDWEQKYLEMIPRLEEKGYQIVMGTFDGYVGKYHTNIPYPVEFSFPVRTAPERGYGDPAINRNRHLYFQSDKLTADDSSIEYSMHTDLQRKDYDGRFFKTYLNKVLDPTLPENVEIHTRTLGYLAELKAIEEALKATGRIIPSYETPEQKPLIQRRNELKALMQSEFKEHRIRTKKTLPVPFYEYFEKQYMYKPSIGIFAGFVSVFKNRRGIENFWRLCVEYLLPRYRWVHNRERNDVVLSNQLIKRNSDDGRVLGFGKDERMLMFGVTPKLLDSIFFFEVTYTIDPALGKIPFFTPNVYFSKLKINKRTNLYSLEKIFERQNKVYTKWFEELHRKYPTEEAYLNAINANVDKLLIPYENLPVSKSNKKAIHPYNAFTRANRKATVRRGGRRTQKVLRTS